MTDEHVLIVLPLDDGWHQARCVCGFRGTRTQVRQVAGVQAEQHRQYIAEVAKLTGRDR